MSAKDNCGKVAIYYFYNLSTILKHWNLSSKWWKKAKRKANMGCTRKLPELLFFFPNQRQGHSMIICVGSAEVPDAHKVAFKNTFRQTVLMNNTPTLSLNASFLPCFMTSLKTDPRWTIELLKHTNSLPECKFPLLLHDIIESRSKSDNLESEKETHNPIPKR